MSSLKTHWVKILYAVKTRILVICPTVPYPFKNVARGLCYGQQAIRVEIHGLKLDSQYVKVLIIFLYYTFSPFLVGEGVHNFCVTVVHSFVAPS